MSRENHIIILTDRYRYYLSEIKLQLLIFRQIVNFGLRLKTKHER